MKIIIKFIYPFVENLKLFTIAYSICFILLVLFIPINNYLNTIYNNTNIINFPKNVVYSEQDAQCTNCEKSYTSSLQTASPHNLGNIDNGINLSKLSPIDETSTQVFNDILVGMNQDSVLQNFGIIESQNSLLLNQVAVPNRPYGVDKLLVGNYPIDKGQVLLPESYALKLVNEKDYKSYNQLLNTITSVTFNNSDYKLEIVGIYTGANNLIVDYEQDTPTQGSSFITFENNQQAKEFAANNPQTVSYKNNTQNYAVYSKIVCVILVFSLFLSLTIRQTVQSYQLRKVHVDTIFNIYIFIVPLIPLVVLTAILITI